MQDINFEYGKQYRAQKKVNINTGKLKDFLKNLGLDCTVYNCAWYFLSALSYLLSEKGNR